MKRGEAGEEPFTLFLKAVKRAQASVESKVTKNIINASADPRFWAAGATYLERTKPDRWARRSEDTSSPKVIVQIGVKDSDVQVQIGEAKPSFRSSLSPVIASESLPVSD